jgi:hypothetical protein
MIKTGGDTSYLFYLVRKSHSQYKHVMMSTMDKKKKYNITSQQKKMKIKEEKTEMK